MILRLKQLDILTNDSFVDSIQDDELYTNAMIERINSRYEQIDKLKKLLSEDLQDIEFYHLVLDIYNFIYTNSSALHINFVSDYNLSIIVRVKSDQKFENKIYTLKELMSLYYYHNIYTEGMNYVEFDEDYMSKHYDLKYIERINNEELKMFYKYIDRETNNYKHNNINTIKEVKEILTKERIENDLNKLISFTRDEIEILKNQNRMSFVDMKHQNVLKSHCKC